MAGNWGAILAGLAGGAGSLAQSMDKNEQRDERRKERAEAAMRQLAIDSLNREKDYIGMGAVDDTGDITQGDMATGLLGSNLSIPTGLGTAEAGMEGLARALGGAKGEEQGARRFSVPGLQGGVEKKRIDEQTTPEAKAMRRLTQQQTGQQRIEEYRTKAAEERAEAARKASESAADKRARESRDAAERLANKPQRVQVDDGNGGLKWAWLRPGQEAPVGQKAASGGGGGSVVGAQAPLDDMITRYEEIEAHGKDIADKKFKFTNTNATREALGFGQTYAQSEGKPAIGAQLGQTAMDLFGLAKANNVDQQRYARLMASTRAFGDDAAKVFKGRQGFQNISYEVAQATLRPEDYGHPEIIEQKLNRMRHVVKLAALVAPNQAKAADPAKLAKFLSDKPTAAAGKPNPEY